MVDSSFFVFMVVAVLAYGVQGSLQAHFARKYDALIVTLYRNLSLGVTMLPILFLATWSEVLAIREHLVTLILASSTGAFALVCSLSSSRYLPIGISSALRQMVQVAIAILLGILLFREYLTFAQLLVLAGLAVSAVSLTLLRSDHPHLDPRMAGRGIALTVTAGVSAAFTFYFFSVLSRELNPFVSTYFWEIGVGLLSLLYFIVWLVFGQYEGSIKVPFSDAYKIIGVALLTIPASTSYAFAVNHGPYALAGGIITMTTLVATVIGWAIYKEHLTKFQIGLIVVAVALMFLLKVLS